MLETRFQNTETTLKNQQVSIQGLETQIGQLSKLIFERPQGTLPSNTEPNPREHFNEISTQDKEGFIAPEPELMQETVVSTSKSGKLSFKEVHESCSRNDRGHIYEERRLQIKELDEWRAHKLRTHDKPELHQNKADTFPNQLKVGDKVLLDAADPHIVTTTPNKEIPLTVLSIFPFDTVEVSHPKYGTFKVNTSVGMEKYKCARKRARFCFFDTGARHARAIKPWTTIHGHGTLCHHREARRPQSHPQRNVGDWVFPRYVLQPKFGTHSLNFRKLRRRSCFRYYARDPSVQVAALTGLP
ncbi:hypothetical protein GOBAR_AA02561 [Gossypium barbadense]|uniref:Uncharacterized protein n=1 Tax=Gossypium barbadense TaxID=3634 RepID=A0A2P5YQZ0_GOSBA|nr:hypothetical protein GOBAR_AA02561 [Gossypium barbadense]